MSGGPEWAGREYILSQIKVKDLVALILGMRDDNTISEEAGLGV